MASRASTRTRGIASGADENATTARAPSRMKATTPAPPSRSAFGAKTGAPRASSTLRRPLTETNASIAARAGASKASLLPAVQPPAAAAPVAVTSSITSASALVAMGLPSVLDAVHTTFAAGLREAHGCDIDYRQVLARNIVKKAITMNFKDHDALVKTQFEQLKAAFADLVQRRNTALDVIRARETELAARFADAAKLSSRLQEVTAAKAHSDAKVGELQRQLEQALKDMQVVSRNQSEADAEVDEANRVIATLNAEIEKLQGDMADLEQKLQESDDINRGLEDDKDDLRTQLTQAKATIDELTAKHSREVTAARESAQQTATSATSRIHALTTEVQELSSRLQGLEKMVKDLEKANGMLEIEVSRARAEKESAIASRALLAEEFDRFKRQQEDSQHNMMATMDNFTRNHALHIERERELGRQVDTVQEKLASMTAERDALRVTDAGLRIDLREAATREQKLTAELAAVTAAANAASQEVAHQKESISKLTAELHAAHKLHERFVAESTSSRDELVAQLNAVQVKLATAEDKLAVATAAQAAWEVKEAELVRQRDELTSARAAADEAIASLTNQLETLRDSAGATEESQLNKLCAVSKEAEVLRRRVREMAELKARMAEAEAAVARMKEQVFAGELERRRLHNIVQELKGNIRVFVRVRPFLPGDAEKALVVAAADEEDMGVEDDALVATPAISTSADGTSLEILPPPPRGTKEGPAKREMKPLGFAFDTVFGQRATQEDVYNEVSFLVQSALDGYNVCLFSYGQTGSGKTFTMQGGAAEAAGLIPRSVKHILDTAASMAEQGWEYALEVSFLEIYNETLRDLLRVPKAGGKTDDTPLAIHQDGDNVDVPGLTRVEVASAETIDGLLARAEKRRAVAATSMNERSSRSHQVFTLYITGRHAKKGLRVSGQLNLVDLAGSERLARSGAEGDRKKEAAAINKSLSCLADVFTALAKKTAHVPFRNSKLTQLLQPCFRGEGKTLMLVNLSPTLASAQESLCSLRFAAQVAQVELGKAKKRVTETAVEPTASARASMAAPKRAHSDVSHAGDDAGSVYTDDMIDQDGTRDADLLMDDLEASTDMIALDASRVARMDASATHAGTKRTADGAPVASSSTSASTSMPASIPRAAAPGTHRGGGSFVSRVRDAAATSNATAQPRPAPPGMTMGGIGAQKKARTLK